MIKLKKLVLISASTVLAGLALMSSSFAGKEPADDYSQYDGYQCVAFVKEMGIEFPKGINLTSWQAKVDLIQHGIDVCPQAGWVAIVDTRTYQPKGQQYGHIAYVENANEEDGTITVVTLDGNWTGGKVYRRTGTPSELKIVGYWAP
jgi:surface antigen